MTRTRIILLALVGVLLSGIIAVLAFAPDASIVGSRSADAVSQAAPCLRDDTGACLRLPPVNGVDVDNDPVRFPDAFSGAYNLVVMPFDRDQQVNAITWLPLFQELADEYPSVNYYSIAALPELNVAIRTLVIGGMSAGVREQSVRDRTILLFLEEQERFIQALGIADTHQIRVLLVGRDGTLYWQQSGEYSTAGGEALRAALRERVN